MKTNFFVALLMLPILFLTSCSDDDDTIPIPQEISKTYQLASVADPNISGTAKFIKNDDNSVTVELQLSGTPAGGMHPAHIHNNTAVESGGIAVTLGTVDGDTGSSTVTFTELDDATATTYEDMIAFDGYINVHLSATDLATLVAQGDIGQNELTGTTKAYNLTSVAVPNIDGVVTFSERVNGEALAVIKLENTPAGGSHPAHIHNNTAVETGGIAFTFNPVNGDTGLSATNVSALDDATSFGYDDVIGFDGYINVHLSATDLATLVAQGDIGQNELTGESTVYTLNEVDVLGINGDLTFFERANGEALAVIELVGTPVGGVHPAHIHAGSVATAPGAIVFTFTSVDGDTGTSKTNVSELDDATTFGYADAIAFDGYVNVHVSAMDLATLVAQGDIGSNVN